MCLIAASCLLPGASGFSRRAPSHVEEHLGENSAEQPKRPPGNVSAPKVPAKLLLAEEKQEQKKEHQQEERGKEDEQSQGENLRNLEAYLKWDNATAELLQRFAVPLLRQLEYEIDEPAPNRVSKVTLAMISLLGFGCCGIDRFFVGQFLLGGVKGLLCGGGALFYTCATWGMGISLIRATGSCFDILSFMVGLGVVFGFLDWAVILLSCLANKNELHAAAFSVAFDPATVHRAVRIAWCMPLLTPMCLAVHLRCFNLFAIALRRMDARHRLRFADGDHDGVLDNGELAVYLKAEEKKPGALPEVANAALRKLDAVDVEDMVNVIAPWPWDSRSASVLVRCEHLKNTDRLRMRWFPWGKYMHEGKDVIEVYVVQERREGEAPRRVATLTYADAESANVPGEVGEQLVKTWQFQELATRSINVGVTQKTLTTFVPVESDASFATLLRAAKKAQREREARYCPTQ